MKDYTKKIQDVVDYIEEHLLTSLSNDVLMQVSGLSLYHFHRVFSAAVGESLKAYIRKRRLSYAAESLVKNEKSIIDLALDCGFESQEAFTRAFQKMFAMTPGELRGKLIPDYCLKKPVNVSYVQKKLKERMMEPVIKHRPAFRVIGPAKSFHDSSFEAIGKFWEEFLQQMPAIKGRISAETFGICSAQHPAVVKQDDSQFIYIPCVPVDTNAPIPAGMVDLVVPENKYAVFTHKGPLSEFPQTLNFIWGNWVPNHQNQRTFDPDFELYDERFQYQNAASEIDVYIPVK